MTVRVLVVDDSVVVRRSVADVLGAADDIEVVATASDGRLGLRRIAELHPDVVTLDVEMPGMGGLEALGHIRRDHPGLPVIMYSTLTERGARATFDALALGAVDYATKPTGATTREGAAEQVRSELLPLVRLWGRRGVGGTRAVATETRPPAAAPPPLVAPAPVQANGAIDLVMIGVSTGGPDALARVVPALAATLPVPVAIVQHMPPVFTGMLAQRLDAASPLHVSEAVDGEALEPGHVYIAPGGRHLLVESARSGPRLALGDGAHENSCRPAVDVLFRSAVHAMNGRVLAVVLTGMGQDGLEGARLARAAGAPVLAQDEASSVVWGMPGFVVKAGLATGVHPVDEIALAVNRLVSTARRPESVS